MAVCIIPARGGSKRIPRKNIRPFAGRPMIAWPIQAARESGLFRRIIVSTDDEEIAAAARDAGAEVPFLRSAATADDHTGLIDVLGEVQDRLAESGDDPDLTCCVLATAALTTAARLRQGLDLMCADDWDAVFPVVAFGSPIQRALARQADGSTGMIDPGAYAARSQDLEARYHDAGQFYWLRRDTIRRRLPILASRAASLVLDEMEVQDIDTEADWRLAEMKHALARERP